MTRLVVKPADLDLDSPGRRDYWVALEHDTMWGAQLIPLTVWVGAKAEKGRGLVAFGSTHGNEYEGPVALKQLLGEIDLANVTGRIIQALGGSPLQLPPTEAQQAMASGVADGITFPQESIEFFKITPVIKGATRVPGGLYTDTFWLAINEAKWNSLSAPQKAAFEKHSGPAVALLSGWAWTNGDNWGRAALDRNGVVFATWSDADVDKARAALDRRAHV